MLFRRVFVGACVAFFLLLVCIYSLSPFAMLSSLDKAFAGLYEGNASGDYIIDADEGVASLDATSYAARTYQKEAERISTYAKSRWSSESGDDVYDTPSWQWLWAYDTLVSNNNQTACFASFDEYETLHEGALKATRLTKTITVVEYVEASEGDEDAFEIDGVWYVQTTRDETVSYWHVTTKSFASLFSGASGTLSEEFKYFAAHESAQYGPESLAYDGWAIGYYQMDFRYGCPSFISWLYDCDPDKWSMFSGLAGAASFPNSCQDVIDAWTSAYETYPQDFAAAQDEYEYLNYYASAESNMESVGVDISTRRDAVRGLCCGITNLFGSGGSMNIFRGAGVTDVMNDYELAAALCTYIINNYPTYANRYTSELAEVTSLLDNPPAEDTPSSTQDENSAWMAQNYYTSALFLTFENDEISFDATGYRRWLQKGGNSTSNASYTGGQEYSAANEVQKRVVDAVYNTPSPGGALCLGWVCNVFQSLGINQRLPSAYEDFLATDTYSDKDIPVGAVVYGTGSNSQGCGHIGIYIGDGMVADNQGPWGGSGSVVVSDFETWCSWQTDTIDGRSGYLGWDWFANHALV